ncbi:hypothetical protein, partial [Hoylesella buccalis]|uniref:hypothetical protein n=1 Tax=Hoylesella buccalis TaxID=28127 RepID=UPI00288B2FD0
AIKFIVLLLSLLHEVAKLQRFFQFSFTIILLDEKDEENTHFLFFGEQSPLPFSCSITNKRLPWNKNKG